MDTHSMTGELRCGVCDAKYETQINSLSEPIDIFTEWLDETSNLQAEVIQKDIAQSTQYAREGESDEEDARGEDLEDDVNDIIDDDEES